ncbi:DEAD/DEAH box helicase [Marinilabiliaceae bacterium ANBcel2]|nr:DEAD/DEAH box helicase [Marinilabiliaceae bacterium ANBcel2]
MKFAAYNLDKNLLHNLVTLGFKRPTDIQYKAIPAVLEGEDLLAIAQTGTGKTAAYAIPVIDTFLKRERKLKAGEVRCIVMVPTHELAAQVNSLFSSLTKNTSLRNFALYGGVSQDPQKESLNKGLDILAATPGRLFDLASQGDINFSRVEVLVVDEADHMLEKGFFNDITQLVKRLPFKRQTLFFSATIDKSIKKLAYKLVKDAVRIHISPKDPVSKNVDHSVVHVKMDDKRFFLERIIKGNPKSKLLVFVRTKVRAERVVKAMHRVDIFAESIHGDKIQKERSAVLEDFRCGNINVLIATDVSARGIDIEGVEYVINYDMPDDPENYVHRVGRTGRGSKRGIALSFCDISEQEKLKAVESYTGKPIPLFDLDEDDYEAAIDLSVDADHDWQKLIDEAVDNETEFKNGKRKRKKSRKKR